MQVFNRQQQKKIIGRKKFVINGNLKFEDYKHSLEASQIENEIN